MSTETLELNEEEKAIILEKREEEKANGLLQQKAYDKNVETQTKYAQKQLDGYVEENDKLIDAYEVYTAKLNEVAPNYKLVKEATEYSQHVSVQKLEYIDAEGKDIYLDSEGGYISSSEQQETIKTLTAKAFNCKIVYTGDAPEGVEYHVTVGLHYPRSSYSRRGEFKMRYNGTNISWEEGRKNLKVAKTVNTKILEAIQSFIRRQEYDALKAEQEKVEQALAETVAGELAERFPNAEQKEKYNYSNGVILEFPNGTSMLVSYSQPEGGEIKYTVREIKTPNTTDLDSVAEALASVTVTKED